MDNISFDDFKKIEIRIGKVTFCEKVENADKLLKLEVDFGDYKRQILSYQPLQKVTIRKS